MDINWSRLFLGIVGSALFSILGLGAIIGIVIAFSAAESIADVQNVARFSFVTSVLIALSCGWGALVALRGLKGRHILHGFLIGLAVGLLNYLVTPASFVTNLLTLLMALPAGIVGGRLAQTYSTRSQK